MPPLLGMPPFKTAFMPYLSFNLVWLFLLMLNRRPDLAKEMGFVGAKIPLRYGPADGEAGIIIFPFLLIFFYYISSCSLVLLFSSRFSNHIKGIRKNVQIVKEWREKIGPDFPLSIDCYMSLVWRYYLFSNNNILLTSFADSALHHPIGPCP